MNALLRLRMCCRRLAPHAQACLHWLTGRRRNCTALCNSASWRMYAYLMAEETPQLPTGPMLRHTA